MKRAAQFMPFSPLRGFYEELHRAIQPPREQKLLSEEEAEKLNEIYHRLERGMKVIVTYYREGAPHKTEGAVGEIEPALAYLYVGKEKIYFREIERMAIIEDKYE